MSNMYDSQGKPLTQGLFLEINYDENYAVYTLKEKDHEYNGKVYKSLKRLYIECEDPTEYIFATKYLLGWQHWKRICRNKLLLTHIQEWREELEIKLRAQGVRAMIDMSASESGSFQAAKYLADKGWDKREAGRPSKSELERRAKIEAVVSNEYSGDIARLADHRK